MEEYILDLTSANRGEGDRKKSEKWAEKRLNSKKLLAELIGASPEEVAFVPNASTGINTVLNMLPFKKGTNIVSTTLSFPMCATAVNRQRERGARPKFLKDRKGIVTLEQFDKAINDKTVAVMIDQPSWFNGYLHDLRGICEVAHDHGAKVLVDGTQSVGSLDWDANKWGVDFIATSTYKWILGGPYNQCAGFLFVTKSLVDEYQPVYVGTQSLTPEDSLTNTENMFTLYDYKPRKGITKFEIYPRFEIAYVAVENSMRVILDHGRKPVERQVKDVGTALVENLTKARFKLQTPIEEDKRIYVNVLVPNFKEVGKKLHDKGVVVSPRVGGLRLSPHFYNTVEEAEEFVKILRSITKPR
jgi:selenocysteine lyase/cysteine desulfurase